MQFLFARDNSELFMFFADMEHNIALEYFLCR